MTASEPCSGGGGQWLAVGEQESELDDQVAGLADGWFFFVRQVLWTSENPCRTGEVSCPRRVRAAFRTPPPASALVTSGKQVL